MRCRSSLTVSKTTIISVWAMTHPEARSLAPFGTRVAPWEAIVIILTLIMSSSLQVIKVQCSSLCHRIRHSTIRYLMMDLQTCSSQRQTINLKPAQLYHHLTADGWATTRSQLPPPLNFPMIPTNCQTKNHFLSLLKDRH